MKFKIGNIELKNQVILAPMAGITSTTFRSICKKMGASLVVGEMVSDKALIYDSKKTFDLLKMNELERPISQQIFGGDPDTMGKAAKIIEDVMHPDIIDINMGCPVPKVAIKNNAGSNLLKDPKRAYEVVKAVVSSVSVPVTVKIRSGWDEKSINAVEIAKLCEKAGASAITVHGRTRKQGYTGVADWNIIKEVVNAVNIPVIGNGDIKSCYDAKRMLEETGCDAVMIGRASLGNPWFIKECVEYIENGNIIEKPTYEERLNMIKKHFQLLKENTSERQALLEIRTHALWYIKYLPNNKEYKNKLNQIKSEEELYKIIDEYLYKLKDN